MEINTIVEFSISLWLYSYNGFFMASCIIDRELKDDSCYLPTLVYHGI